MVFPGDIRIVTMSTISPGVFMRILVFLAVLAWMFSRAAADVEWEKQEVVVQADVGAKSVTGEFVFRNTGNAPITIKQADVACACSIAEMNKTKYAPGETGKLAITFEIGDRTGTHIKTITVRTDDPGGWVHRLFLKVRLVEPPAIAPRMVYWHHGEAPKGKALAVTAAKDETVRVTGVQVNRKLFDASVETVEKGKRYVVTITPKDTRKEAISPVEIQTDWPASAPRTFKALARVMPDSRKR